jgi:hypothetical protein
LKHGANKNLKNKTGESPLDVVANPQVLEVLNSKIDKIKPAKGTIINNSSNLHKLFE